MRKTQRKANAAAKKRRRAQEKKKKEKKKKRNKQKKRQQQNAASSDKGGAASTSARVRSPAAPVVHKYPKRVRRQAEHSDSRFGLSCAEYNRKFAMDRSSSSSSSGGGGGGGGSSSRPGPPIEPLVRTYPKRVRRQAEHSDSRFGLSCSEYNRKFAMDRSLADSPAASGPAPTSSATGEVEEEQEEELVVPDDVVTPPVADVAAADAVVMPEETRAAAASASATAAAKVKRKRPAPVRRTKRQRTSVVLLDVGLSCREYNAQHALASLSRNGHPVRTRRKKEFYGC